MELFENDYGTGSKELDDTDITTTLLYFSTPELKEFKRLCKSGIKKEFGEAYIAKGNLSDLLLILLRREYEHRETVLEKDTDGYGDEQPYRDVLERPTSKTDNIN